MYECGVGTSLASRTSAISRVRGDGGRFIWLERRAVDQLYALRQRDEELSDVIL
jgi:hypothetical protein